MLLVFAACFAVLRKEEESLVVVPLAGLFRDLTTSDPIGTSVLGFAPIVLLAAAIRLRAMESQFIPGAATGLPLLQAPRPAPRPAAQTSKAAALVVRLDTEDRCAMVLLRFPVMALV